jgi:hypothetical protein
LASSLGDGSVTITYAPQPAPDATTGSASNVTDTTGTVAGTVNPNSLATTYHVEYGTDSSYGRRTADGSAGNGYFAANVSGSLTGLQPATVYHYRLVATSASGTTYGVDQSFETTAPPVVSTGPASGVTDTAANLAGTLNAEGLSTKYHFDYGTTGSYGQATPDVSATGRFSAQPASASLAGLQAGMGYHYRLVATNSSGTSYGLDQVLHTTGRRWLLPGARSRRWVHCDCGRRRQPRMGCRRLTASSTGRRRRTGSRPSTWRPRAVSPTRRSSRRWGSCSRGPSTTTGSSL